MLLNEISQSQLQLSESKSHQNFNDYFEHQVRKKKFARQAAYQQVCTQGMQKMDENGIVKTHEPADECRAH